MSDQCKLCIARGDLKKCLEIPCFLHENWAAIEIMGKLKKSEHDLAELVDTAAWEDALKRLVAAQRRYEKAESELTDLREQIKTLKRTIKMTEGAK